MAKGKGKNDSDKQNRRRQQDKSPTPNENNNGDPMEVDDDPQAQIMNEFDDENLLDMQIPPMPEPVMASDGSGKRLIITKMELENFKSYYGKQVIGPMHKNFTAVIGPNGSGKSNVIDALLFVFGYRSTKIRSKKLSVLIHSSTGKENISSCTVVAHFRLIIDLPDDTHEDVPNSEFFISRTAYKDNSSKYTYNGKTMQFKEIAKHLRAVGIDLIHNRFLILQGEVEQISLMKPKAQDKNEDGMLEYLEDIIGSSRLVSPIEKLQAKVEQLQEQRGAQLTRLKYAEKEKDEKEAPVKKLIEQIRVDNAIALTKNKIFHVNRLKFINELDELKPKLKDVTTSLEENQNNLKEVERKQKERKSQHKDLQKKYDKCQEESERASKKLSDEKQQFEKAKSEETRLNDRLERINDDLSKEVKRITELEEAPEKSNTKITDLKAQIEEAKVIIQQNEGIVQEKTADFDERTDDLKKQKKIAEEKIGQLADRENDASKNLTLAQEELLMLQSADDRERKLLADIKDSLVEAENTLSTKKTELQTVKNALPRLENELKERKTSLNQLRQEEAQVNEEYRNVRFKYEQNREIVETSKSSNKLLNALMDQKRCGNIPGIFGRMGDLGAIDQKYDVAISTTCGLLDFIVTDNIETSQQCVEFLRKNNLGIASFIALDKQQHLIKYMKNKPQTPENAPRMFDLIKVLDEKILPAFYYALRDTLVADDIVAANRIAFHPERRWRTVTLKGEVIETSGSMTGGGKATKKGRIGQNVKIDTSKDGAKDLAIMERQLQELDNRLIDIRRQISGHDQKIAALQKDFEQMTQSEKTLKDDIKNLEDKLKTMDKQVKIQEQKVKESIVDQKEVAEAKKRVEKLKQELDVASEQADKYRAESARLNNQIDDLYEEIVGQYKKKLEDAQRKKEAGEKSISKEQSAANTAARNLQKAKARAEEFQRDIEEVQQNLHECKCEQKRLKEEIKQNNEDVKEKETALKEADANLKEALNSNTDLNDEEIRLQKLIGEIERDVNKLKGQIAHQEHEIKKITNEISSLKIVRIRGMFRMPDAVVKRNMEDDFFEDTFREEESFIEQEKERTMLEEEMEADPQDFSDKTEVPEFNNDEVYAFNFGDIKFRLGTLEQKKAAYKEPLKMYLLEEYMERLEKYEKELALLQEIQEKRDKHREFCERLKKQRLHEFMEGFSKIGLALKELYQTITIGGDASLDLVDTLDPFAEGVSFAVRPPKKSWKQITNLSGGEKTLSSLALVFGLHQYRPTPLYVMDEIDAALDFRNVSIIAHYLKERTKNAQFIIISLRNNMFELADRLVGIYKTFDCTKNVVVDPKVLAVEYQKERRKLEDARKERRKKRETTQTNTQDSQSEDNPSKRNRSSEVVNLKNENL